MRDEVIVSLFYQGHSKAGLAKNVLADAKRTGMKMNSREAMLIVEKALYNDYMQQNGLPVKRAVMD